ncbi:hypothetical protein DFH08DRAFT_929291 [Mycena albidolilacea]|uniref:Uncharacterized protein n=1 Tax=Mycena albidolilacea TaxID=1033008 RepID=A0AAD7F2H5_9AGAR|nr:hypothetical protein DFH08DRAFT_929291 [Mycena albidolilacea]
MNYEFYNPFAFSVTTPASSASASRTLSRSVGLDEDRTKKRLRLPTRMRRRAISSSAINSIAVVTASLDRPLFLPLWHEANGAFLNVSSEDLDVCVPDAPNLDIEPADVDTEEQDPVSSVRVSSPSPTSPSVVHVFAPVVATPEPVTEVDSVHLDHCEQALDIAESLLSTAVSASTTTSSPSNIAAEGEGNVDDGTASDNDDKHELEGPMLLQLRTPLVLTGSCRCRFACILPRVLKQHLDA